MNKLRLLILFTILLILASCYYPGQIVVNNESGTPARISVPTTNKTSFFPAGTDSLLAYDHTNTGGSVSSRDLHRFPVLLPLLQQGPDNPGYAFVLGNRQRVILQSGWPVSSLSWGQAIVINETDTVVLHKKSRPFQHKGGTWTYTISKR